MEAGRVQVRFYFSTLSHTRLCVLLLGYMMGDFIETRVTKKTHDTELSLDQMIAQK